jgi:hypothetical protein
MIVHPVKKNQIDYKLKTKYGKFILRITVLMDRNTNTPKSFTINLGTKTKFCVQIKVPSKETGETDAYLMWVEAHENCSLERYIEKGLARHMVLIGLTLTRKLNPSIQTVSFEDTSSFDCELPDDKEIKVPMKAFHIAFHEATWYEYYFGARLKREYDKYCRLKKNIYKSENKPKVFDFVNDTLQEELEPLYEAATNWYDFFQAISKKYGNHKCGIVYPWITKAMNTIFESNIYDDTQWYIDFKANEEENKTPLVEFDMIHDMSDNIKGGHRKTLKNRKNRRFTFSRTHMFPNIPEIHKMNYKDFIRKKL